VGGGGSEVWGGGGVEVGYQGRAVEGEGGEEVAGVVTEGWEGRWGSERWFEKVSIGEEGRVGKQ